MNHETLTLPQRIANVQCERRKDGGEEGKLPTITGYAAVYWRKGDPGTEYRLLPDLVERIMPGAFKTAVQEDDVRSMLNHSPAFLLGRSSSGTARFTEDKIGLRFEVDPPNTEAGRTAVELVGRGDVDGASFQFLAHGRAKRGRVVWVEEKDSEGRTLDIREIHELELFEGGPVDFPAYEGTSAQLRSREMIAEIDAERRRVRTHGMTAAEALQIMEMRGRAVEARQRLLGFPRK